MAKKHKNNPYVSTEMCNERMGGVSEVIHILKGNPNVPEDLGLMGEIRDIKRDRKWIYALITLIGIPVLLMLFSFLLR